MPLLRRIIDRVGCPTCGAFPGDFCRAVQRRTGNVYRVRTYAHAARKSKFRQLIVDKNDECFGKFYVAGNHLCDEKCDDRADCRAICRGEMTYEDRYRNRKHQGAEPQPFALVEILSSMLRQDWTAGVQAVPGRFRGEPGEGTGEVGRSELLPDVQE